MELIRLQFAEAVACMPALLILDGLEVVCPAVAAGADPGLVEPGGDALVAWLCDVLAALRAPSRPPVPGAVSQFRPVTGVHTFWCVWNCRCSMSDLHRHCVEKCQTRCETGITHSMLIPGTHPC